MIIMINVGRRNKEKRRKGEKETERETEKVGNREVGKQRKWEIEKGIS